METRNQFLIFIMISPLFLGRPGKILVEKVENVRRYECLIAAFQTTWASHMPKSMSFHHKFKSPYSDHAVLQDDFWHYWHFSVSFELSKYCLISSTPFIKVENKQESI